ncbi:cytochrome-c peroxidase [Chitinophaga sancti]|uniref:cytochrome-c peroxidase n=1 Tax=Chitinophaga sancti TaxID=1004 RepID=UPI003F799861
MKALFLITGFVIGLFCINGPRPYHIDYPAYFGGNVFQPEDNPTTIEGVELGRRLFYDTRLSANNKMSCGTCHQQKLAFTDGKTFSQGHDGTLQPRNTMAIENMLWVKYYFWDGRASSLEEQALVPMTSAHEMGQPLSATISKLAAYKPLFKAAFGKDSITGDLIVKAIAQFERTLISDHSRYDQYLQGKYKPSPAEQHGIDLFYSGACSHCHGGPKTYSNLFANNGLDSLFKDEGRRTLTDLEGDKGNFRVTSLRNIALTAPYMHDGRFKTLEEVLDHYNEHIISSATLSPFLRRPFTFSATDKSDIIAFLHMLTDSTFTSDPRFSDPFN